MHSSKDLAVSLPTFLSPVGTKLVNDKFCQRQTGINLGLAPCFFSEVSVTGRTSHIAVDGRYPLLCSPTEAGGALGLSSVPKRDSDCLVCKDTRIIHDFSKIEKDHILW